MYESRNLTYSRSWILEKNVFQLPHHCDEWIIGNLEEAKLLYQELGELIKKVETGIIQTSLQ